MFRDGIWAGRDLWLAGHFQGHVSWSNDTLTNAGDHQLMLLRQPLGD